MTKGKKKMISLKYKTIGKIDIIPEDKPKSKYASQADRSQRDHKRKPINEGNKVFKNKVSAKGFKVIK